MDILSSQANLAGYKAVLDFAYYQKAIPMMMTAAGTIPAVKVLVVEQVLQDYKQLQQLKEWAQ